MWLRHAKPEGRKSAFAEGFGVTAFTRFAFRSDGGLPSSSSLKASEGWWACLDSNQEPDRYERPALTIELQAPAS